MLVPSPLRAVHFAVRTSVIARYLGQILLLTGLLGLVPLAVSLAGDRLEIALRYGAAVLALVLIGGACSRVPASSDVQRNEGLVILALAFGLPPFVLAVPLTGYGLPYGDAVFEAVSGLTTTGLSVAGSVEHLPFSFHFARAWLQWIGGLGFVALSVAFLLEAGTVTKHLGFDRREVDDLVGGMRAHARRVVLIYAALTAGGIALLLGAGLTAADAVVQTLAAVSTGGFSNHDLSLAALPSEVARFAVIALCFAGALPFSLYYRLGLGRFSAAFADAQFRGLLAMTLIAVIAVAALMAPAIRHDLPGGLEAAALTAISAQTTAGFSIVPFDELSDAVVAVLIAAMLIGGSLGSTAGGIKILRLLLVLRLLQVVVLRCSVLGSAFVAATLGGKLLDTPELQDGVAVIFGFTATTFLSFLVFLAAGQPAMASLFEVASAVGTVGLSSGLSAPDLAGPLKAVLCFDMLAGRIEVIALLILLFPDTWIGKRHSS